MTCRPMSEVLDLLLDLAIEQGPPELVADARRLIPDAVLLYQWAEQTEEQESRRRTREALQAQSLQLHRDRNEIRSLARQIAAELETQT